MRKSVPFVLLGSAIVLVATSIGPRAQAAPTIWWETTFDCPEWVQGAASTVCAPGSGVTPYGGWTTALGKGDQITTAANNPIGGGGRGFRHWRGYGSGSNGGGVRIEFPSMTREFWVRFYMRYQNGYAWSNLVQTKDLYVNVNANAIFTIGFHWADTFGPAAVLPANPLLSDHPPGWASMMPGGVGDGQWHAYEVHVKMDTNGSNGISETWVDGQFAGRRTNVNWGTTGGWTFFVVGSNACCVANTSDVYNDFDDFAISTTGYIGPIGGGSTSGSGPSAPTNLRITS